MALEYNELDEFLQHNCGEELNQYLAVFNANKKSTETSILNILRDIKIFLGTGEFKSLRINLFKNSILHGNDCLTLSVFTWFIASRSYNLSVCICRPTSFFRKYHALIGYWDESHDFKLFKVAGKSEIRNIIILDGTTVIKQLKKTKPIIHFINTKIRRKY